MTSSAFLVHIPTSWGTSASCSHHIRNNHARCSRQQKGYQGNTTTTLTIRMKQDQRQSGGSAGSGGSGGGNNSGPRRTTFHARGELRRQQSIVNVGSVGNGNGATQAAKGQKKVRLSGSRNESSKVLGEDSGRRATKLSDLVVRKGGVDTDLPSSSSVDEQLLAIAASASMPRLEKCPALVLNADFQPLSYLPLSLWPWTEVMKAVCLDRVRVIATYDDVAIRSPQRVYKLPSVVVLNEYQKNHKRRPAFSRYNVFLRDKFCCQYCNKQFRSQDLTFDHVVPKCKGGKLVWENVVTACIDCNNKKGSKLLKDLPDMKLYRMPIIPTHQELQNNAKVFPLKHLHESWLDYIYWDSTMHSDTEDEGAPRP